MIQSEYDYIIVGGGTAGGVLAARLSEDAATRVLVLEAGADERNLMMRVPAGMVGLYQSGQYHWDYQAEPEVHAAGQVLPYKLGKVLGGSSAINALVWVRGAPQVYDGWASVGCEGWAYRDVEPLFRRIERFSEADDPHMGQSGPIAIKRGDANTSPLNRAFLEAAAQAGYPGNDNYNGPEQEGACLLHRNTDRGERSDVYREYLRPVMRRSNLTIRCNASVERVLLESDRVTGVEFRDTDGLHAVYAAAEVILCAGSIATPQLLMLSGIGPADRLGEHAIEVKHDLTGVGRNLHTHPTIRISYACPGGLSLLNWTRPPRKWLAGLDWLMRRQGRAATNHLDVGIFARTRDDLEYPDAEFTFSPLILAQDYGNSSVDGFDVYMELIGVKSRGWLGLRSANPADPPRFRFNFLKDRRDLEAFRRGVAMLRELVAQKAFDGLRGEELSPGVNVDTEKLLDDWIRRTASVSHHLAGSCRMGSAKDPLAVVDPQLRVRGLQGLRIADNSIMPFVSNGNTHAPAIMIGEKAADLIRAAG